MINKPGLDGEIFSILLTRNSYCKRDILRPWGGNCYVSLSWLQGYKNRRMVKRLINKK